MGGLFDRTTLGLAAIAAVLYFLLYRRTGFFPLGTAGKGAQLMAALLPRMVLGILVGVAVAELLPREVIEGWLSDRSGWRGHAIGWTAGIVAPIGMPYVLYPLAAGLMAGGAGVGPIVTFLTASALFGPIRVITFELPILGGGFFALRLLCVFWMPPVAGYLAQGLARFVR
ncbi:MAG: hypothetical protein HYZ11_09010 [Candidatus Tectomicrobia bacterium]|uniref:Permease n=1 Tax=Tectimicrobiota bacterium TaxID=2528274 RepID=A0A932I0A5_UNCTE|nr:hypothetical protein [Candidatus Tectomicrobia bacterium]